MMKLRGSMTLRVEKAILFPFIILFTFMLLLFWLMLKCHDKWKAGEWYCVGNICWRYVYYIVILLEKYIPLLHWWKVCRKGTPTLQYIVDACLIYWWWWFVILFCSGIAMIVDTVLFYLMLEHCSADIPFLWKCCVWRWWCIHCWKYDVYIFSDGRETLLLLLEVMVMMTLLLEVRCCDYSFMLWCDDVHSVYYICCVVYTFVPIVVTIYDDTVVYIWWCCLFHCSLMFTVWYIPFVHLLMMLPDDILLLHYCADVTVADIVLVVVMMSIYLLLKPCCCLLMPFTCYDAFSTWYDDTGRPSMVMIIVMKSHAIHPFIAVLLLLPFTVVVDCCDDTEVFVAFIPIVLVSGDCCWWWVRYRYGGRPCCYCCSRCSAVTVPMEWCSIHCHYDILSIIQLLKLMKLWRYWNLFLGIDTVLYWADREPKADVLEPCQPCWVEKVIRVDMIAKAVVDLLVWYHLVILGGIGRTCGKFEMLTWWTYNWPFVALLKVFGDAYLMDDLLLVTDDDGRKTMIPLFRWRYRDACWCSLWCRCVDIPEDIIGRYCCGKLYIVVENDGNIIHYIVEVLTDDDEWWKVMIVDGGRWWSVVQLMKWLMMLSDEGDYYQWENLYAVLLSDVLFILIDVINVWRLVVLLLENMFCSCIVPM